MFVLIKKYRHLFFNMDSIASLYKFYITHPTSGLIEVFPKNNALKWAWKREKGQAFYRKTLESELTFKDEEFKMFHTLDRSNYKCEKIPIEIHRSCGASFDVYHVGFLALIDMDFNVSGCRGAIKVRNEDAYTCILANWQKERDIIKDIAAVDPINLFEYTVEEYFCQQEVYHVIQTGPFFPDDQTPDDQTPFAGCLDFPDTFAYNGVSNYQLIATDFNIGEETYLLTWSYKRFRSESITEPEGGGWTEISSGVWVKPLLTSNNFSDNYKFSNGRLLNDVVSYFVDFCNLTYVSNFFASNPDATQPANFAYDYADQYFQEVVIFQKSDIRFPDKTEKATKALLKFKDLLEYMNIIYNVQWSIDGGIFRIEHQSYFQNRANMLDLTQPATLNRIRGFYKYKYTNDELPRIEKWAWMEKTETPIDFDLGTIIYDDVCSYDDDDVNETGYSVPITTNIDYIITKPDEIADAGFVLMSKRGTGILVSAGQISGEIRINMSHSWANLLYNLHRHGRPQNNGELNGENEAFFYTLPSRLQEGLNVKLCCDDITTFSPMHKVKTQLGWGIVDSAQLNDPGSMMTLNLLHD